MKAKPRIALLSLGITLSACQPTPSDTTPGIEVGQLNAENTSTLAPNENASIIVLDPATGDVATASDVALDGAATLQLLETTRTPASELETIISDDGTVTIVLDESYSSPLMATIDCDGNLRTQHVDSTVSELPVLPGSSSGDRCPDVATGKPSPEASQPSDPIVSIGDQGDAQ